MGKRGLDIVIALLALAVLAPLILAIMFALRLTGEGEVFFRQDRMGFRNRVFKVTKFATMLKSAAYPREGEYVVVGDARVLPLGRFLRATKLNELPQLWDVLRGSMSLVGPRPQMLRVHALYPLVYADVLEQLRPGITGVGSIVFRDEELLLGRASDRDYCYKHQIVPYKVELEQWYAAHRSIWLDVRLIALTAWYVIHPTSRAIARILPARLIRERAQFDGIAR